MFDIVYYYVVYYKNGEIHLKPFQSKNEAEEFKKIYDEKFKKDGRYKFSKIRRSKVTNEIWI